MVKDIFLLGQLFEQVQMQNIFGDGKTFVDCTPRSNLSLIQTEFEKEKNEVGFDLKTFVEQHFILPETFVATYIAAKEKPLVQHLHLLWDELNRQPEAGNHSLLSLPYSYIVPGGRFREIYYWDSFFTMLGLQLSGKIEVIKNMVNNFSSLINQYGYIPNGNRSYFLGRSQPPFFAAMVNLLCEAHAKEKTESILIKYLPQLEKEYAFWMKGADDLHENNTAINRVVLLPDGSILNCYSDELNTPRPESFKEDMELAKKVDDKESLFKNLRAACESGWDFSSRWYKNENDFTSIHTTEIIPVDLNCLLYNLEQTIAQGYRLAGEEELAKKFEAAAYKRKQAINKYCWNDNENFYFDYDFVAQKQKTSLTLAGVFPLYLKIATAEQAEGVASKIEKYFLQPGGLLTTIEKTGQQWDAPNGWAPLQFISVKGLLHYGHHQLAKMIAERWMTVNEKVFDRTGKMLEKYNVEDINLEGGGGEYPTQDGFGWSNGVYLKFHEMFKTKNQN